jgi:hypothetical protein
VFANVGVRVTLRAIDEEAKRWIVRVVKSRNLDHGTRPALTTISYLNLRAFVIELRVSTLSTVHGDMFNTNKILPRWRVARIDELHPSLVPRAPIRVRKTTIRTSADDLLVDLELVSIASVLTDIPRGL